MHASGRMEELSDWQSIAMMAHKESRVGQLLFSQRKNLTSEGSDKVPGIKENSL